MDIRKTHLIALVAYFITLLSACGGGGGSSTDNTTDTSTDSTTDQNPPPPTSLYNRVLLYLAHSSSSSSYDPGTGLTLEADTQYIFRADTETGDVIIADTNTGYDFANSTIHPYTVDDRFFVRRQWDPYSYTGHHDYTEFEPLSNTYLNYFDVRNPNANSQGCSAVVGNTYFYQERRNYDYFYGDTGGEFFRYTIGSDTTGTSLIPYGDGHNCKGNLYSSEGSLYDAENYTDVTYGDTIALYQRNTTDGLINIAASVAFTDLTASSYQAPYKYAFDQGVAYWARKHLTDGSTEIWRYDFANNPERIYSGVIPGFDTLHFMDADNGYIALGDQDDTVFLFDTSTGQGEPITIGFNFYSMQILYIAQ